MTTLTPTPTRRLLPLPLDRRAFAAFVGVQVAVLVALVYLPLQLFAAAALGTAGAIFLASLFVWPWIIVPAIVATTALDITGQLVKQTGLGIPVTGFHIAFALMAIGIFTSSSLRRRVTLPAFELKVPLFALWGVMAFSLLYTPNLAEGTVGVMRTLALIGFLYGTQVLIDSRCAVNLVAVSMGAAMIGGAALAVGQMMSEEFYLPASFVIAVGANAPRATGTFHNPNTFGTFLMCGTVFLLGVLFNSRPSRGRVVFLLTAIATGLVGLVVTFSRANWLAALVGIGLVLFLSGKLRYAVYAGLAGLVAIVGIKEFVPFAEHIYQRFVSIFTAIDQFSETGRASSSARIYFALAGLEMWLDNPILGAGWRAFPVLFDAYKSPSFPHWVPTKESHTLFANILAEVGLVGFLASAWIVVRTVRRGWEALRRAQDPQLRGTMAGLVCVIIAFQVSLSFTADFSNNFLWFFTGMVFAVARLIEVDAAA